MILVKFFLFFVVSHQLVDAGWVDYDFQNPPPTNTMILAGLGENGKAYVGRVTHGPQTAPGELVLSGIKAGLHFSYSYYDYVIQSGVKYYKKEDDCQYRWVQSSHGAVVHDAVENFSDTFTFYVGRYFANNFWHVGKVTLEAFVMFYTAAGKAESTPTYEVLTCTRLPRIPSKAPLTTTATASPTSSCEPCSSNSEVDYLQEKMKILEEALKFKIEEIKNLRSQRGLCPE